MRFPDETGRSLKSVIREISSGDTITLAPGRYEGPIVVERGVTLRGAGDLTRVVCPPLTGSVFRIATSEPVVLESLLLEGGRADFGGAIDARGEGPLRLYNLHIRNCSATEAGGAIYVSGGRIETERVRLYDVRAQRGGAISVEGQTTELVVTDSEIRNTEAELGGALWISGGAEARLEGVTIFRARATSSDGGQTLWASGRRGTKMELVRVRFEDPPVGRPIMNEVEAPARISIRNCDLPRWVQDTPGLEVTGETQWR